MKNKILLFSCGLFFCFYFLGCAAGVKIDKPNNTVTQLEEALVVKDQQFKDCQGLAEEKEQQLLQLRLELAEKDSQLKEKDLKVKELKKKLESFGSF